MNRRYFYIGAVIIFCLIGMICCKVALQEFENSAAKYSVDSDIGIIEKNVKFFKSAKISAKGERISIFLNDESGLEHSIEGRVFWRLEHPKTGKILVQGDILDPQFRAWNGMSRKGKSVPIHLDLSTDFFSRFHIVIEFERKHDFELKVIANFRVSFSERKSLLNSNNMPEKKILGIQ